MSDASMAIDTDMSIIDQIAHIALLPAAWARYVALKNALQADRVGAEEIVEELSHFLTNVVDGHAANGVH